MNVYNQHTEMKLDYIRYHIYTVSVHTDIGIYVVQIRHYEN